MAEIHIQKPSSLPRIFNLGYRVWFFHGTVRLLNWDSPDTSVEVSPILLIDRSSRSIGDRPPTPNTANLTPSLHVVDIVVKDSKGRARSTCSGRFCVKKCARERSKKSAYLIQEGLGKRNGGNPVCICIHFSRNTQCPLMLTNYCEKPSLPLSPSVVQWANPDARDRNIARVKCEVGRLSIL